MFLRRRAMKKPPDETPPAVRLTSRLSWRPVAGIDLQNRKTCRGMEYLESRNSASHGHPWFALNKGTFFKMPDSTWLNSPDKKNHLADNRLMGKSSPALCGHSLFPTSVGCDRPQIQGLTTLRSRPCDWDCHYRWPTTQHRWRPSKLSMILFVTFSLHFPKPPNKQM